MEEIIAEFEADPSVSTSESRLTRRVQSGARRWCGSANVMIASWGTNADAERKLVAVVSG
jgi:hypothetical protein